MLKRTLALCALILTLLCGTALAQFGDNIDWEKGLIVVKGNGAPPKDAVNGAQSRYMARHAAEVDAKRQLAELVNGVWVDSSTTVKNMIAVNSTTQTKVSGLIKGAKIIDERQYEDGGYEVTMTMPLFGQGESLASAVIQRPEKKEPFPAPNLTVQVNVNVNAVGPVNTTAIQAEVTQQTSARYLDHLSLMPYAQSLPDMNNGNFTRYDPVTGIEINPNPIPQQPQQPMFTQTPLPEEAAPVRELPEATGEYTSLVIDCSGLGLEPCMSPVIRNEVGEAIYGVNNLDYDLIVVKGMASYAKSLDLSSISRAGTNPLIVKGLSVQRNNIDPVISIDDANKALVENEKTHFLSELNVVFVR